jgi:hypothetical protein
MKACHLKGTAWALLSVLMLLCCSHCGSAVLTAGGGVGGTGFISRGIIIAFGSIFVNGTELDTSNAVIIVEGEEMGVGDGIALDNLDIGMVVTVEGTLSEDGKSTIADRVIYNDNVEGPVQSISDSDTTTKEVAVLGQNVILDVLTEFKGTTFDTIELNDVVEISGLVDDTGAIRATFLEKTGEFTPGLVVEIQGFVVNLDADLETFEINDLTVDYSLADVSGLPGGVPADGLWVEVEGVLDNVGGEMMATEIQLGDEVGTEDADQIEFMGFVTDFVSVSEFSLGNQVVHTDGETLFVDGRPEDVALGAKLEAEGSLMDGILFAEEIEFWGPDQMEVEGLVTEFVSVFEFTVGDQVVHTDAQTAFVDGSPDDIMLGVKLEIKGRMVGNILVADKVSFENG